MPNHKLFNYYSSTIISTPMPNVHMDAIHEQEPDDKY